MAPQLPSRCNFISKLNDLFTGLLAIAVFLYHILYLFLLDYCIFIIINTLCNTYNLCYLVID